MISIIINFLIVVCLMVFAIHKLNIKEKLQNIANDIKNYVVSSEDEKESAKRKLEVINGKIQKLPELKERIKKSTLNSVKNYEKKIQQDIEEERQDIFKNANRIFRLEEKNFKEKLVNLLSEKSIETAKDNAIEQLKENSKLHNHYIDKAIEELDEVNI